jgi:hypothetical protein
MHRKVDRDQIGVPHAAEREFLYSDVGAGDFVPVGA